jgi:hypothetical protein
MSQILQKIQQIIRDRVMFAPVANFPYSAPYEDLTLKAKCGRSSARRWRSSRR